MRIQLGKTVEDFSYVTQTQQSGFRVKVIEDSANWSLMPNVSAQRDISQICPDNCRFVTRRIINNMEGQAFYGMSTKSTPIYYQICRELH